MTRLNSPSSAVKQIAHSIVLNAFSGNDRCYAFAVALHRGLGWPLIALEFENSGGWQVGVKAPDETFWDARGQGAKTDMGGPFSLRSSYRPRIIEESVLSAVRPLEEHAIAEARQLAEVIWPELPWKNGTHSSKILAFMDELEELSRKHGVWIRPSFPGAQPFVVPGSGNEQGYEVAYTNNAQFLMLKQILH